jgi:uncharacterized protein YbcC (UPF0753/DUF2309 family)
MVANILPEEIPIAQSSIQQACARIPPLWPLQNFVAVNPFMGLSDMPFHQAAALLERMTVAAMLMDASYYIDRIRSGAIGELDVQFALAQTNHAFTPRAPLDWLTEQLKQNGDQRRLLTVAEWLDHTRHSRWADFVTDEISKWCSSYFDRGQSSWPMPWAGLPLYEAWKQAAAIDRNPEIFGLPGFRKLVSLFPSSPEQFIDWALSRLNVPPGAATDFLHRELMSVFGWSAYAAYQDRAALVKPMLPQLLAIRLAYDVALLSLDEGWECQYPEKGEDGLLNAKHLAQLALENSFRSRLLQKMSRPATCGSARKSLQAIFCIDVRSEIYRRALESQSPEIETVGFAGFFGMAVEVSQSARCPVLVAPKYTVHTHRPMSKLRRCGERAKEAWMAFRSSAAGMFPWVEAAGGWFGLQLLWQFLRGAKPGEPTPGLSWHIPLAEEIELAAQMFKNMSLNPSRLAPVVLVCGHGGKTENNPYASSLDCGACGGHKGDINARVAAMLLNKPQVRQGLSQRGILIPHDTVFVAGLHITTTDDVVLFDAHIISPEQREQLARWLQVASRQARLERSRSLIPGTPPSADKLDDEIRRRSVDWSEVRPEWGLAGNAAFIAAPRSRTQGIDLEGRAFLHEYDPASDPDGSVLTLVLTAPVVVASWINLQYYGSTVNNQLFGSGNKVLHNVVGAFGVWEGNGGDLRTGLPIQSLHDGARWMHEPLRLQVVLDAPRDRIDKVLKQNPEIRKLVENHWIHLMAMEGSVTLFHHGLSGWKPYSPPAQLFR